MASIPALIQGFNHVSEPLASFLLSLPLETADQAAPNTVALPDRHVVPCREVIVYYNCPIGAAEQLDGIDRRSSYVLHANLYHLVTMTHCQPGFLVGSEPSALPVVVTPIAYNFSVAVAAT